MKKIGVIGLGKMGFNISLKALSQDYQVFGYDCDSTLRQKVEEAQIHFSKNLKDLVAQLPKKDPKILLMSLPAGTITKNMVVELSTLLEENDIVIDTSNSFYKDSLAAHKILKEKGIQYVDAGVSGGVSGARNGGCYMVGGSKSTINYLAPLFHDLATKNGFLHTGSVGSGHFAKMIHNGIEYGMMQAIGEGFDLLEKSNFDYDLEKVAHVWNHGSIITSSLMGWTKNLLAKEDASLKNIPSYIKSSGEGLWTVQTALEMQVSIPVITMSLLRRFKSHDKKNFGDKIVSGMRREFGGHNLD